MIHGGKIGVELTTPHITTAQREAIQDALVQMQIIPDTAYEIIDTRFQSPIPETIIRVREIREAGGTEPYFIWSIKTRLSKEHGAKLHHETSGSTPTYEEAANQLLGQLQTKDDALINFELATELTIEGERTLYKPAHGVAEGIEISIDTVFKTNDVTLETPRCRVKFEIIETHEPTAHEIHEHIERIRKLVSAVESIPEVLAESFRPQ